MRASSGVPRGGYAVARFRGLAIGLATNQVATGLALTILGLGLAGLIGAPFVGQPRPPIPHCAAGLSQIPIIGPAFFRADPVFYLSVILVIAVAFVLKPHPRRPAAARGG